LTHVKTTGEHKVEITRNRMTAW